MRRLPQRARGGVSVRWAACKGRGGTHRTVWISGKPYEGRSLQKKRWKRVIAIYQGEERRRAGSHERWIWIAQEALGICPF